MTKKLVAALLALVFALAGCLGGGGDIDADDDGEEGQNGDQNTNGSTGEGNGTGNNTEGPDDEDIDLPEPNEPPTVDLSIDEEIGMSPFEVTFTLKADDPNEDDDLAWTLSIEDGDSIESGTNKPGDFPIEVTHEFTTGRYPTQNFTVVFDLSDGEFSDTVAINVTVQRAPNPVQEGDVDMCSLNQGLPLWGAVDGLIGGDNPEIVDTEPGTNYHVEADGEVQIAFMNDEFGDRTFVTSKTGKVPEGRTKASVCVVVAATEPPLPRIAVPASGVSFTYQDGLQPS